MIIKVAIGSQNPVKLEAVKQAFAAVWPSQFFEFVDVKAPSLISHQPMSDNESINGALNRALFTLNESNADYAVGLEAGLHEINGNWFNTGWAVILTKEGQKGIGSCAKMLVPPKMISRIKAGGEMSLATDEFFGIQNTKNTHGPFGAFSNNLITSLSEWKTALISALVPFINPQLFNNEVTDEAVDIVDEINNVLYTTTKKEAHDKNLLHRTVIGELRTSDGKICLVRQTADRQDPGQYVSPIGGHITSGESEEDALIREAAEEIGIKDFKYKLLGRKIFTREVIGRKENHYYIVFQITHDGELKLGSEADAFEYFTPEQIQLDMEYNPAKFGDSYKFIYQNFYD